MPRLAPVLRLLLVALGVGYLALAGLVRVGYRAILYPAPREARSPTPRDAVLLTLAARDGTPVHAFHFPAPAGAKTVVCFHGNAETIGDGVPLARTMTARGVGVVLVELRGYGLSRGAAGPSEEGLYADAEAVLEALAKGGARAEDVVLWGRSLGSGVAAEMARRGHGGALVLVSPYTSIPDMAATIAPFLPVRLLVGDRFDTRAKAAAIAVPTVVIHGDADEVIPFRMGEEVAGAIPGARFLRVEGGHHNDLFAAPGGQLVGTILGALGSGGRG